MALFGKNKNQNQAQPAQPAVQSAPKPVAVPADAQLEFGYWWVGHRSVVKNVLLLSCMVISGFLLLYGLYGLTDYYLLSYSVNKKLYEPRAVNLNWNYLAQISMPDSLILDTVKVVRANENYDLIVPVKNPNDKWYVEKLTYHFDFSGQATPTKIKYVLPLQTVYLAELNLPRQGTGLSADLVVEDIQWKKEPAFQSLYDKFYQFDVTDISYVAAQQTGIEGAEPVNQVKFKIKNVSPQNFWDLELVILLYGGTQLRGVNVYNLPSLDALEQKEIVINWPGALPPINKVNVIPQIDILDPNVYKGFEETPGELK